MRTLLPNLALIPALAIVLIACTAVNSSSPDAGDGSGDPDVGASDTGFVLPDVPRPRDTSPRDSAPGEDARDDDAPVDDIGRDTDRPDTAPRDVAPDVREPDTTPADTVGSDTVFPDIDDRDVTTVDTTPTDTSDIRDTATTCSPFARECQGRDVARCTSDGARWEVETTCSFGCQDARCVDPCDAPTGDHRGCRFTIIDLDNIGTSSSDAAGVPFGVAIHNPNITPVNTTFFNAEGLSFDEALIPAGGTRVVSLPRRDVGAPGILNPGVVGMRADAPVAVTQLNPIGSVDVYSSDGSLLLPDDALGTEYVGLAWPTLVFYGTPNQALESFVTVANPIGNPEARVTIEAGSTPILAGNGLNAIAAFGTTTITLQPGAALHLMTQWPSTGTGTRTFDLTGVRISSSAPVAVWGGSECANVPTGTSYCDHLEEQLLPVDRWGTTHVAARFQPRGTEPDVWRVLAATDGTRLTTTPSISGLDGVTLARGQVVQVESTQDFVLTASRPVSVGHYMVGSTYPGPAANCDPASGINSGCLIPRDPACDAGTAAGDPAFALALPTSAWPNTAWTVVRDNFRLNWATLAFATGQTVTVNGTSLASFGGTTTTLTGGWTVRRFSVPTGALRVESTGGVFVTVHGYDCDVSYAWPGGIALPPR